MSIIFQSQCSVLFFFFFFQAEDGIRDVAVTGVQTCALPIYSATVQLHHFRKAFFDPPTPFQVITFLTPADLECMLEGGGVIRTQEHVDGLFPTAQPFFSLHHHRPTQVRSIPFFRVHLLPPFFSNVLRKRYDSVPVSMMCA